VVGRVEF